MADLTLDNIAGLLKSEFDSHLEPINQRLTNIEDTLASHTATLDAISKNTQNWEAEKAAMVGRMNRMEEVIKRLAIKVGMKLDWPDPINQ